MNDDVMKELRALCEQYAQLTTQREQITRQVETLLAPKEPKPETTDDVIKVGDLVEVVTCKGDNTTPESIGCGGVVAHVQHHGIVSFSKSDAYRLPSLGLASFCDCRKVAVHARPVTP